MSQGNLTQSVGPDDHAHGPANAPITLVEYGDYECSHCGRAYLILQQVLRELGDDVRFVFRNFPLNEAHPHAQAAAEAAESVAVRGGEDAFWVMHDLIYENQDALQHDDLIEYAAAADVNPRDVADDLATGAMRERVRRDFRSGVRSGVNGTPTFFVNGRRFDQDWTDADAFTNALREAARVGSYTAH
jgi:protein-disulfide isomerase